jgi:hypothetical protein
MVRPFVKRPSVTQLVWIVALICGVAPLWATQAIPLVDLPQHLHLISVLHRIDDASTLFPEWFARRPELTPYLGYYYVVSGLNWLMPLELANRVFLSLVIAGLPLSLAFLLRSLNRPAWPALLAMPFAYGDSFAWGFINYCAALPLALLTCGFFVRAIATEALPRKPLVDLDPAQRWWRFGFAGAVVIIGLLVSFQVEAPTARIALRMATVVATGVVSFLKGDGNLQWLGNRVTAIFLAPWLAQGRARWALGLGFSLVAVLLFHVQAFAYLGVALPFLLLTTPAPEGKTWKARVPAVLGVLPGVLLFVLWVGLRVGQPQEIAPGQPWRSWGPMLSKENLGWKSFDQNLGEFISIPKNPAGGLELGQTSFPILAGMTPDGSDQNAVRLVFLIAVAAVITRLSQLRAKASDTKDGPIARWRIVGLGAIAFILLFALPFDIRGYMYYLNTRYAHLAAALLVVAVPVLSDQWSERFTFAAGAAALVLMGPLWTAFKNFDAESRALTELAKSAGPKPKVMGLVYSTGSRAVTHPVYLHAGCVVAREAGGLTNFSFALTPHSPLMYRGAPPPTFASEWRPDQMRWDEHGRAYDHFVVRGPRPEQILGAQLQNELYVAAQAGDFFLVRRR